MKKRKPNMLRELLFSSDHPEDRDCPVYNTFGNLDEIKNLCTEANLMARFLNIEPRFVI